MNTEMLKRVVELAADQPYVWLATSDADGSPHVTTAGTLMMGNGGQDDLIVLREWFCPATLANTRSRPAAAIVVWPGGDQEGFQLLGHIEGVTDHAILDGYDPAGETKVPIPQALRDLRVRIEKVLHFRHGPHSDAPVEAS